MASPNPFNFPVVVTTAGMQPQNPQDIRDQLLAAATAESPGLTANLPGILIDDVLGTDTQAIALIDQARVETVNSLTPNGANEALLLLLGQIYGVPYNQQSNTSVPVVFSGSPVGYVIPNGLLVKDTSGNLFQVQSNSNGVISGGGSTGVLTAIAVQPGSFGVPAGSVDAIATSLPPTVAITVTNPNDGTPGGAAELWSSYRARVLQGGLAACVSGPRLINTLIGAVPGVQKISVQTGVGGLRVIVKGGNVYQVAAAILDAVGDPTRLIGSAIDSGRNVTVSVVDPPNTYNILSVAAQTQTVTMAITWNTTLSDCTGGGAFASLVQAPLIAYINSIAIGQPINVLEMNEIFQEAVANLLDPVFLTRLVFAVSINTVVTPPGSGTYAITGDSESDFFTALDGSGITVTQG